MRLHFLDGLFCVCRLGDGVRVNLDDTPCFLARTGMETSFICPERSVPADAARVEGGWKCFRVCGVLDFSVVGVMAGISGVLAEAGIPLLALSTFDTDYILIRRENEDMARRVLAEAEYVFD